MTAILPWDSSPQTPYEKRLSRQYHAKEINRQKKIKKRRAKNKQGRKSRSRNRVPSKLETKFRQLLLKHDTTLGEFEMLCRTPWHRYKRNTTPKRWVFCAFDWTKSGQPSRWCKIHSEWRNSFK